MVQRVWEQACLSRAERVVIATDDRRIYEVAQTFGAQVAMTSIEHTSGTDRLQEVIAELDLADDHIVVNVQGDEPLIPPQVIDQVAENLNEHPDASIATLCEDINDADELVNPNVVKVVRDARGMALYFSRAPIPWPRDAFMHAHNVLPSAGNWYRHIGLYAYRVTVLHQFVKWPPAPEEQLESLEQLRLLHYGADIHVDSAACPVPAGVDTHEDLLLVRDILKSQR
jgi:3-deoxy-manno-octulosonate cytidylyltransferase (CMP-KDO synthetase)